MQKNINWLDRRNVDREREHELLLHVANPFIRLSVRTVIYDWRVD